MPEFTKTSIPVIGMACAACAVSVQSMLQSQPGVKDASVNYGNRTVKIEYDAGNVELQDLRKVVQGIGYDLLLDEDDQGRKLEALEHKRFTTLKMKLAIAATFSLPVFILSMFFHHGFRHQELILLVLSLPVVFYAGSEFYISAYRQISKRALAMDSLVAVGTGVAFLYSAFMTFFPDAAVQSGLQSHVYFESAAVIITFVLLGRFLEEKARRQATSSIRGLMSLRPETIQVNREGESYDLSPALVVPGDLVMVKAGDRIPVDGKVTEGTSVIDESAITGEPMPRQVETGSLVFAGTMNLQGFITVEATQPGNETMLARVIRLVDEAQSSKPPVQKLVEKISGVFVPVVFLLAAITFLAWLVAGGGLATALVTSISVLVIACPCALGLATPAALIAGIGRGASEGILIRNAEVLETANKVNVVIFDKTGTITEGKVRISEVVVTGTLTPEDCQALYDLESRSNHPLALAVTQYLPDHYEISTVTNGATLTVVEIPGKGIRGTSGGNTWLAGSRRFMEESGLEIREQNPGNGAGNSMIYFARNNELLMELVASDVIRESSKAAVSMLEKSGIHTVMLSGDQESSARKVALACGITEVFAGILPDGKGEVVRSIQDQGKTVAMVGDGINDAYALARAQLGIAMGSGTDVAMESASVVLVNTDLRSASKSILLSKATVRIIRQNLFWAFFYNVITIPVAAGLLFPFTGFLLNPMIAGAAMAMSSVSVMLNSLRLKWMSL